jgi:uncharacterized SAM-binding protein YcdF (DUF218 family)
MFTLSKIVVFFLSPGVWLALLLIAGTALLWTRWRQAGRWILTITGLFVAIISIFPLGLYLIGPLEDRFPAVRELSGPVDGIIVLGGAVEQRVTRYRGQPTLTDAAERMTTFVVLAKRFPAARLVFSGGSGLLFDQEMKETETARLFFTQMGIDQTRILFEAESRNTYENAIHSFRLVRPGPGERWVLVTSAMHMPRAVGVFRKAGWKPIPYPVDFHTFGPEQRGLGFNMFNGLFSLTIGLREWTALIAYRLLGRTDAIFPTPLDRTT